MVIIEMSLYRNRAPTGLISVWLRTLERRGARDGAGSDAGTKTNSRDSQHKTYDAVWVGVSTP
jgi:hypothetical protein